MTTLFHVLVACAILAGLAACGGNTPTVTPILVPTASPTATIVPLASVTPTVLTTSSPLYQSVTLSYWSQITSLPELSITIRVPALTGSLDPRALKFNHEMSAVVDDAKRLYFNINSKDLPVDPHLPGSSLDISFKLLSPPGNFFSLKFYFTSYVKGAAHPFDYTQTANYDLEKGEDVTLDQLFLPGSDYLGVISAYCITKLQTSEIRSVLSAEGAQPDAKNYRNWNITADGLIITFDEYQVAPYAVGPQLIIVPYSELQSIIDPQGPLVGHIP